MFELEVDHVRLSSSELDPNIRANFLRPRSITHLSDINWEEHCTECAWPSCYQSCDLYSPRNDGNCRRTIDGFSPLLDTSIFGGYVVRVKFKRWASLTARSHVAVRPFARVSRSEAFLNSLSLVASRFPKVGMLINRPGLFSRALRRLKGSNVASASRKGETRLPNCFTMEIYNPSSAINLSLDIASRGQRRGYIPFKQLLTIEPGFQRIQIPFNEIQKYLADTPDVELSITPNILNPEDEGLTLYLGVMTFAYDTALAGTGSGHSAKKVKVVIWDLDNTIWNGTLIEDGPGNVVLRSGIRDIIIELDRRGIVNSIASKNHERDAFAELERFGLREYFAFPSISWSPKSEAVRKIIKSFNVGEDTIVFVDDQQFEREEVAARNPKVRTYRDDEGLSLLQREEFDVPVTEEGRGRRAFYQNEEIRQQVMEDTIGGYLEFLKKSSIQIRIVSATPANIDRIHELVQRTNQMNFSGTRYTKQALADTLSNSDLECYLIDAEDKFGKYGYIGFAVLRRGVAPQVIDLAFSCRVQSKRVEHAVLISLMMKHSALGARSFEVLYRPTEKNAQVAQVFDDLKFSNISRGEAGLVYRLDISSEIPKNEFVKVEFKELGALAVRDAVA